MRLTIVITAILLAGPASALSCLRPDAVRLFEQARDAEEAFYIVAGEVMLLEAPNLPERGSKVPTLTRARVDGLALTQSGFKAPFSRDITIETSCLGPWCGSLDGLKGRLILGVKTEKDELSLRVGPCGGDLVQWDQSGESRLLECYLEGVCKPAEF